MICLNDTHPAPKTVESYRVRKEAMDAAVFVIGPHARHGFEYETSKVDGRWIWRHTDEVRPDTPAELKANGGKKSLILASTPMAHIGAAKPVKLPVPPRRTPPQAQGKPAGAPDGGAGGEQPLSDEATDYRLYCEAKRGIEEEPLSIEEWRDCNEIAGGFTETAPACNGLDIAKPDGLDLPTFLKREPAPAKSGTYDELKSTGALRSEPLPLSPAAAQLGRMGFTDVAQNPSDGLPAKPVGKPPASRKVAKTAPKAAKRASKAPAERAAASGGKTNIGAVARTAILKGKSNEEALAAVMKAFPDCSSNAGCMAWYRNKLKKEGHLKQDGTPSAKGEAMLAGPTKAA